MKKAVVLLSGGLDSATTLAIARNKQFQCYALSVDYGQRHESELVAARNVARSLGACSQHVIKVDLAAFGGSALTNHSIDIPITGQETDIPVTYVPARNTIMLSLALAWAETLGSHDIFIGVNAVDYSGYPDCRPEYIKAFENMANLATKAATKGHKTAIHTPLIMLPKEAIIRQGIALGLDYSITISCYQADEAGSACGVCDSCRIRRTGFNKAGLMDPTRYRQS
ncbi:preQ(0) biosynthesis protein QueC [Nitrosomonas cryotolerans]|uniref:7-cyano-7-deazaguanine synthase n=1 Tax=Nitrosomonas cryotolerans ATCC 49181 TaxID=1131553 RepID=A0A1N6G6I6_9PROT|nr:7-cyano-7-deazaguanine synthase QueC [Nitrosomonas cryotolerans]SFP51869.1 preQ(0) biosynthesis protein QueC [Nitrosomonas cryotolerans]SIO03159.1 preQ(0) biosynthesis protein QueC [Nitrosomonas cryotolerans ATCC 49181]